MLCDPRSCPCGSIADSGKDYGVLKYIFIFFVAYYTCVIRESTICPCVMLLSSDFVCSSCIDIPNDSLLFQLPI